MGKMAFWTKVLESLGKQNDFFHISEVSVMGKMAFWARVLESLGTLW